MCNIQALEAIMNITLSVDERVAEAAREAARKMGKSLNQVVREHLERLAGQERLQQECDEFVQRCLQSEGRLNGWKFNREEANARR
jgi:antitoxin component of RelBE/YafQ-DinJ toxin-antitoxin module